MLRGPDIGHPKYQQKVCTFYNNKYNILMMFRYDTWQPQFHFIYAIVLFLLNRITLFFTISKLIKQNGNNPNELSISHKS